ncbi:MAG: hypothetical protein Q9N68_09025, partial [Gammaproteobacteria bacterium]|nr:hypothetical protein [Gammaproteobacteria bacterium]
ISYSPKLDNFSSSDYSDSNWSNGVGLFGDAIFFLSATRKAVHAFIPGRLATLADGTTRKIIKVQKENESLIVTLSGDNLDPNIIGYPNIIKLSD